MNSTSTQTMDQAAGIALMAGAVLALVFMLHHPSTAAEDFAAALAELRAEGATARWVHGLLIVVMSGIWFGGYGLSSNLGLNRPLPLLGLLAFSLGTLAYFTAAMVSGFIVPHLGDVYSGSSPERLEHARALLTLTGITNRVFAGAGVVGTATGILAWSLALLPRPGGGRWIGAFGLAAAIVPAALLLSGHLRLHVTGMTLVVAAHGAWYLLAGWHLLRVSRA